MKYAHLNVRQIPWAKLAPGHENTKLTWQFGKMIHRSVFPPAAQQTVNLSDTPWWHHHGGECLVPTIRFAGRSSNPSPSPSSTYSLSPFLLEMYTNRHCTLPDQVKQYLPEHCWAMLSFVTVRFIAEQCLRSFCNFRWNCVFTYEETWQWIRLYADMCIYESNKTSCFMITLIIMSFMILVR